MVIGDEIHSKISEGINSSQFFCIFLSVNSINSKWVKIELRQAIERNADNRIKILPIKIDKCDTPDFLKGLFYADAPKKTDKATMKIIIDKIIKAID